MKMGTFITMWGSNDMLFLNQMLNVIANPLNYPFEFLHINPPHLNGILTVRPTGSPVHLPYIIPSGNICFVSLL